MSGDSDNQTVGGEPLEAVGTDNMGAEAKVVPAGAEPELGEMQPGSAAQTEEIAQSVPASQPEEMAQPVAAAQPAEITEPVDLTQPTEAIKPVEVVLPVTTQSSDSAQPGGEVVDSASSGSSNMSNIGALLFVIVLVAINVYVFMGSKEDASRPGSLPAPGSSVSVASGTLPGPGEPHPPNPSVTTPPNPPGVVSSPSAPPPPTLSPEQIKSGVTPGPGVTPVPPPPSNVAGQPGPGVTPPPPKPAGSEGAPPPGALPRLLSGPQLLLSLGVLNSDPEVAFSSSQKSELIKLIDSLNEPQLVLTKVTKESLQYLTAEQVDWMLKHRGPAVVTEGEPEPGMDPVTSAASKLLRERASRDGKAALTKHSTTELQYHDILNGILKMETEAPTIKLSGAQAQALLPSLTEANKARQIETKTFTKLYQVLNEKQIAWLQANPEKLSLDVNSVILKYVQLTLKQP